MIPDVLCLRYHLFSFLTKNTRSYFSKSVADLKWNNLGYVIRNSEETDFAHHLIAFG
jgi:hypothetical protein